MIPLEDAVSTLQSQGNPEKAADLRTYHKVDRPYFGVANPVLDAAAKTWRADLTLEDRLTLAGALWDTNIHECRLTAAKLLVQARIQPDNEAWTLIKGWVAQLDTAAIADQVCNAGARRLTAMPTRLDEVEAWATSPDVWTRRASLVMTLPWTKLNNPKADDLAARARVLDWAAAHAADPSQHIQRALSDWLKNLARHDAPRVRAFIDAYGATMKPYARRDVSRKLPPV